MKLPKLSSEGGAAPLIVLVSALALVIFFLITNTFEFKDKLFSVLYPKPTPFAAEKPPSVPDQILVKFKPGVDEKDKDDELKKHGLEKKDEIKEIGLHLVKVPPGAKDKVIEALSKNKKVEYVEEDFLRKEEDSPNDPAWPNQWHLKKYNASGAWDITKGDPNVAVAVIDSGVLETHEDLAGKFTTARYNFVDINTDVSDVTGHGTGVMGLVGATTNNAIGVASLGRNVLIMPIRAVTKDGGASAFRIAQGITFAANNGAKVISISLGGTGFDKGEQEAVNYAWGKGVVIVAAAGNGGYGGGCCVYYPAGDENVIAVGATDASDVKASWSSTGPKLDVMSPGVNVMTTTRSGTYGGGSGTSMSSPQVAALAGLIYSAKPTLTNAQVVDTITSTAKDLGATGWDDQYGYGRIDAEQAVKKAKDLNPPSPDTENPTVSITAPTDGSSVQDSIDITASANDNVAVSRVDFFVDGALIASDTTTPYSSYWDTTQNANGSHIISAKAYDAAGNMGQSDTITVTVNNVTPTPTPVPSATASPAPELGDFTPPTVTLSSPDNGSYVKQVTGRQIKASASDNVAVSKVEFYVDGGLLSTDTTGPSPYEVSWNTTALATGSKHTIYAIAYDSSSNKKQSNTNTITIDGVKPTVSLTAPSAGALVTAGSSLALSASASDNFTLQNVVFIIFNGSTKLATLKDTTSPYTYSWSVPAGAGVTYTIKAQSSDKAGNDSTFSQVNITSN